MRILFIISSLTSGGAERVVSTLANELSVRHDVAILKMDNADSFYKLDSRVIINSLPLIRKNKYFITKLLHKVQVVSALRGSIKAYRPDVVVSFMTTTNILSTISTRFSPFKIIISERNNFFHLKSRLWCLIRSLTYPLADGMVVLSKYDFNKYSRVKNKKIIFNPLFMESGPVDFTKKEKIILAVARLVEHKGYDIILAALSKIDSEKLAGWKMLIIGEGKYRAELEEQVHKLELNEKVVFLGSIKNIENYYQKASIFVSASRSEGFPNALSEALSFGCASIATDCLTGPSELIENGKNGYLVEVDNVTAIRDRLHALLDNEKLRFLFGQNAVKMSKKYSSKVIIKEWEGYIEEIHKNKLS